MSYEVESQAWALCCIESRKFMCSKTQIYPKGLVVQMPNGPDQQTHDRTAQFH